MKVLAPIYKNFKVIMTFGREEVITSEQANKLKTVLLSGVDGMIEINEILVQKRDIRMLEPTQQLTEKQKAENRLDTTTPEGRNLRMIQMRDRLNELEGVWLAFKKAGVGSNTLSGINMQDGVQDPLVEAHKAKEFIRTHQEVLTEVKKIIAEWVSYNNVNPVRSHVAGTRLEDLFDLE